MAYLEQHPRTVQKCAGWWD